MTSEYKVFQAEGMAQGDRSYGFLFLYINVVNYVYFQVLNQTCVPEINPSGP